MIEAIKRGDEFAFEQAFINFRGKVYGYFIKKTRSTEDARDLLQITFLKLWQYRSSLSPEYLLDQQLFRIARTVFIDYLRKQNHYVSIDEYSDQYLHGTALHTYNSTEFDLRSRIGSALASMPALRKKIFELNRLQGFTYQEIAQHLSITVKSVDNNLFKALKHLRKTVLLLSIFYYFVSHSLTH